MRISYVKSAVPTKAEIAGFPQTLVEAQRGGMPALMIAGEGLYFGRLTKRNLRAAKSYLEQAYHLTRSPRSSFFLTRIAIELGEAGAVERLKSLSAEGYPPAIFLLGQLHVEGKIVERNYEIANRLWLRAGNLGHVPAQVFLMQMQAKLSKTALNRIIKQMKASFLVLRNFKRMVDDSSSDVFLT